MIPESRSFLLGYPIHRKTGVLPNNGYPFKVIVLYNIVRIICKRTHHLYSKNHVLLAHKS